MSDIHIEPVSFDRAITVEAWVEPRKSPRKPHRNHLRKDSQSTQGEALQALVSQWRPPDDWPGFAAFDATETDGLPSRGYFGAVFDGRYVYFVPEMHGEEGMPTHGVVLRYDTHHDFYDHASYEAYDASTTDGLDTRGFYGGAFDGRYVYFIPRQIDMTDYHSRLLRFDSQGDFKDPASWAAFDIGEPHSQQGAAFDGRYLYFCPGFWGDPKKEDEYCGRVIRFDTQADFKSRNSYTSVDIAKLVGDKCACFDGGAFDGRYIYFVPLYDGVVVRYDTQGDFDDAASWQQYDAKPHGYKLSVGAVFDGTWLYFCAYGHAKIIRFDTRRDFTDPSSWQTYDADHTNGIRTTGFDGGFFDGRFVYFQPFFVHIGPGKRDNQFHSHYLRYDPFKPFDDPESWQGFDASNTDGLNSVGYNAGAFDGRYFYAAPWQQGPKPNVKDEVITHGIVLRTDTLGDHGSFSLRWCDYGHNGGLNAAVYGPSFLVNTDRGCLFVAANKVLSPGKHHVAGTYDGKTIKLFVDGKIVAQREGAGRIVNCNEPIEVGRITDGQSSFDGKVLHATVRNFAHTDTEIAAMSDWQRHHDVAEQQLTIELDTHLVLDGRETLAGKVTHHGAWAQINVTHTDTGENCWRTTVSTGEQTFAVPTDQLNTGYHRVDVSNDRGEHQEVVIAVRQMQSPSSSTTQDYLGFVRDSVEKIIAHQTTRLGGDDDGIPFITVTTPIYLGYRSLGHKEGDSFMTFWFPERPFEFDTFRADHAMWPVLDMLGDMTGEERYREMVANMIDAVGQYGFDRDSGLIYLNEESDFDVPKKTGHSKGAADYPKFKPLNSGHCPQLHLERLWQRLPDQMHRCFRAMYWGLITDAERFDYNRFCMFGFRDSDERPSLTANASHCAFDTAGARMIQWWATCWSHREDHDCLDWARRMTAKWAAIQHPQTGLVPNFFGSEGWNPGKPQQPGKWAETRGTAMTASSWIQAAVELRKGPGAEDLADQLADMAVRLARGAARYAYDVQQRRFIEHIQLDGKPWDGTARYCFQTQEEKDEWVRKDPKMAQVAVYAGAGWYRQPNYYEHCAGSNIPHDLAIVASLSGDAQLVELLDRFVIDACAEAQKLDGPCTPEGRFTFRATGWYVKMALLLHGVTNDSKYLDAARTMADRELAALEQIKCPDWWRMRERTIWLDALLHLHKATQS